MILSIFLQAVTLQNLNFSFFEVVKIISFVVSLALVYNKIMMKLTILEHNQKEFTLQLKEVTKLKVNK